MKLGKFFEECLHSMLSQHSTVLMQSVDDFFKVCPDGCSGFLLHLTPVIFTSLQEGRSPSASLSLRLLEVDNFSLLCLRLHFLPLVYIQISTLDVCTFSSG